MVAAYKLKWPCIIAEKFTREEVNPRIQQANIHPGDAPFGAFSRAWRQLHCPEINPYGSEDCPFDHRDCALAYYKTAVDAVQTPGVRDPVAYFRTLARRRGADRADNRPLARERMRTDGQGPRQPGASPGNLGAGHDVRRSLARPRSVGDLLGRPDSRPLLAPPGRGEGQESPE
jgi:hypothetical protein